MQHKIPWRDHDPLRLQRSFARNYYSYATHTVNFVTSRGRLSLRITHGAKIHCVYTYMSVCVIVLRGRWKLRECSPITGNRIRYFSDYRLCATIFHLEYIGDFPSGYIGIFMSANLHSGETKKNYLTRVFDRVLFGPLCTNGRTRWQRGFQQNTL